MSDTRTVVVTGLPPGVSEQFLKLYFQNKKHSDGGEVEEVDKQGEHAYITFKLQTDAQKVQRKSHIIHDANVKVLSVQEWKLKQDHWKSNIQDSSDSDTLTDHCEASDDSNTPFIFREQSKPVVPLTPVADDKNHSAFTSQGAIDDVNPARVLSSATLHDVIPVVSADYKPDSKDVKLKPGVVQYIKYKSLLTQDIVGECKAAYNTDSIVLTGPYGLLDNIAIAINEIAIDIEYIKLQLPDWTIDFLSEQRFIAKIYIKAAQQGHGDIFIHAHDRNCFLVTRQAKDVKKLTQLVEDSFKEERIDSGSGVETYLKSAEWISYKGSVTKGLHAQIHERGHGVVVIRGYTDDVDKVSVKIKTFLSKNISSTETLDLTEMQYLLLKRNPQEIDSWKRKIVTQSTDHELLSRNGRFYIEFRGNSQDTKQCATDLRENILKQLGQVSFSQSKPGLKHYFKNNDIARSTIEASQTNYRCIIGVGDAIMTKLPYVPNVQRASDNPTPVIEKRNTAPPQTNLKGTKNHGNSNKPSKPVSGQITNLFRSCTSCCRGQSKQKPASTSTSHKGYNNKSSTVVLEKGDIVKFTKAKAVINTVPNNAKSLTECGVLGRAFAKTIDSDNVTSANKIIPLSIGDVKATKVTGLSYQTIIHIGIKKWNGNRSKKALSSMICKSYDIAHKQGIKSIAFPAIGCGKLQFPAKDVYGCVNKEAQKRASIKTYIVVYDDTNFNEMKKSSTTTSKHTGYQSTNRSKSHKSADVTPGAAQRRQHGVFASRSQPKKVEIVQADITKFTKAEVLVNTIANNNTELTKCGIVAKSFAERGGHSMVKELSSYMPLVCGSVVLTSAGNINSCKAVLHASIRTWDGLRTKRLLENVVDKCLQTAQDRGYSSIGFPAVGCGRLKYPPTEVYSAISAAASKAGRQNIQVYIVPFDRATFRHFKEIQTKTSKYNIEVPSTHAEEYFEPDTAAAVKSETEDYRTDYIPRRMHGGEDDNNKYSYDNPGYRVDNEFEYRHGDADKTSADVEFHICAFSHENALQAKDALLNHIRDRFGRKTIPGRTLAHLTKEEINRHILCYRSAHLIVQVEETRGEIIVDGENDLVKEFQFKIQDYLLDMRNRFDDPKDPFYLRDRNPDEIKRIEMDSETKVPTYWTKFTAGQPIGNFTEDNVSLAAVAPGTYTAIETMISKIWKAKKVPTGAGHDAANLSHNDLKINKIQRIENPKEFSEYDGKRKKFLRRQRGGTQFPNLAGLKGEPDVLTYADGTGIKNVSDMTVITDINERWLFHGTKNANPIINQGLDFRHSNDKALFGKGLYLAESPAKADQYADQRNSRKTSNLQMILARTILGHPYIATTGYSYKRTPCRICDQECQDHNDPYDSVIGTHKNGSIALNYREFVIYDQHHSYPEYLITYDRV